MENTTNSQTNDPLGLESLGAVVSRLTELKKEAIQSEGATSRFALIVEQLEQRFMDTQQKYELLRDRYALLKRSNAALCDELVWLRDQIDDLSSTDRSV